MLYAYHAHLYSGSRGEYLKFSNLKSEHFYLKMNENYYSVNPLAILWKKYGS